MRSFRDQKVAAVVVGVDGPQEDPAAVELSPGLVRAAGGRGREVRERQHRQGDAGPAAVVAVRFRLHGGPGSCGHPPRYDVAGRHQPESVVVKPRALAEVEEGHKADDEQARREQRREVGAERLESGADAALGGPEREVQEVGDLLVGEVFEEGQAQRLSLGRRQRRDGLADDRAAVRRARPPRAGRGRARERSRGAGPPGPARPGPAGRAGAAR